jgi:hypothetical protein
LVPKLLTALLASVLLLSPRVLRGEPVTVHHSEGLVHGFLALRNLDGSLLADGDLTQVARGVSVTIRLVFHFKDGSLYDETTVFTQRQRFRFVSDHLTQKGPAFPQPLDMTIDGASGQVTVRYADGGQQRAESEHLDLPADLANGLIPTLMKNVRSDAPPKTLSLVVATPKPRLVKVAITTAEEDPFSTGGAALKAAHYVLKGRNRRHCRFPRAPRWQTTAGFSGVDPRRDRAGLREVGTAPVCRWTAVAHRAREPRLATHAVRQVNR